MQFLILRRFLVSASSFSGRWTLWTRLRPFTLSSLELYCVHLYDVALHSVALRRLLNGAIWAVI
jgi:hypothetical protein